MKYNEDEINKLISEVNLLDYASKNFEFIKRSNNYFCNCPKHIDVTPSLSINPEKNLFYCFSCGIGGNILGWMMQFEDLTYDQAVHKVAALTGSELKNLKQCDALAFYKSIKKSQEKSKENKNIRKILPASELNKYKDEAPEEWKEEGISSEVMKQYNIRIDEFSNRIVYPIYDSNGDLISIKGRTRFKSFKEMKIPKYQYYYKIGDLDFFVGLKENLAMITQKNEVILFEGIKSGMKLNSFGLDNNWLSCETSWLSDEQIILLIKIGVKNVVVAYDSDVTIKKIKQVTEKLRKFVNVFAVIDRSNLLGGAESKMSPVDKGKEIWETLYKERIRL